MNLVIFDLDHTLLPLDSDYTWTEFYIARCPPEERAALQARNDAFMHLYNAGKLDQNESLAFLIGLLGKRSRWQLEAWHKDFMHEIITPAIQQPALELIAQHQSAGDKTLISTATNRFVTMPIVRALGVDTLIATEPEEDASREFTGRWVGEPNFKTGKVTRMQQWLAQQHLQLADFERSFFYSDSINDVPLLERVTDPVATNPSPALEAVARERGWKIIRIFE